MPPKANARRPVKVPGHPGIFPGDLFLKNFGVTQYGRVVFFDNDDVSDLVEWEIRDIPPARPRARGSLAIRPASLPST